MTTEAATDLATPTLTLILAGATLSTLVQHYGYRRELWDEAAMALLREVEALSDQLFQRVDAAARDAELRRLEAA